MGSVAGAAVSVVSGISGLSQQNSAAAAQKRQIASQEKQQALNAQLQYIQIKNQAYADELTDQVNASVRDISYAQSQQNLNSQEQLNNIAVQQSLFDAELQKANADVEKGQQVTQTAQEKANAEAQIGQTELQTLGSASEINVQDINSLLETLSKNGDTSTAIANLLDVAASSGGVNEAIQLLTGGDVNASTTAAAQLGRSQEVQAARGQNAGELASASRADVAAGADVSNVSGSIKQSQSKYDATTQALDAETSGKVATQSYNSARASNTAERNIGVISDASSAYSRKYLSAANLAAVEQGAVLQSDILNSQKSQVKTPGFLDYVNVGVSSYNTSKKT